MRRFSERHPLGLFCYFAAVLGLVMFTADPLLPLVGAVAALLTSLFPPPGAHRPGWGLVWFSLAVVPLSALFNALFNHNGATALFFIGHNAVTAEALRYGAATGLSIAAVILWCRVFSAVMTGDKLFHLFGRLSPKLALIFSMTLRYVPLFGRQAKRVEEARIGMGGKTAEESGTVDTVRDRIRVGSVMVTWALENGVITADSMEARGYGVGRRTSFSLYRFTAADACFLFVTLFLTAAAAVGIARGFVNVTYYPTVVMPGGIGRYLTAAAYGFLAALPLLYQGKEALTWHCSK